MKPASAVRRFPLPLCMVVTELNVVVTELNVVESARPLAAIVGGKARLARRIIARIEGISHDCYAEPFVGMGGVFLRRAQRPPTEIINDVNGEIVNLFRIAREHPDELARQFDFALAARAEYERLQAIPPEPLTDIQRAARFLYIQRLTARGKMVGRSFNVSPKRSATIQAVRGLIEEAHKRLTRVHIERRDWAEFIALYDRPYVLFYLDPLYFGHERDYGAGIFEREDFGRMAALLHNLKGRFVLSINDRPETREIFGGFDVESVPVNYSATYAKTLAKELIISDGREAE